MKEEGRGKKEGKRTGTRGRRVKDEGEGRRMKKGYG